jgi:ribosomal protein S12 methylthiotransferase accessory factor
MPAVPRRLNPDWLAGAVPEGLVLVGPELALDVSLPGALAAAERTVPLLACGASADELGEAADLEPAEVEELLTSLEGAGALDGDGDPGRPPAAEPLVAVLGLAEPAGDGRNAANGWRVIATADEALVVPAKLDPAAFDRLLHDFVAGLTPLQRRRAYSTALARRTATLRGDIPRDERLAPVLDSLESRDPGLVAVVDLGRGDETTLPVEEIGRVGAGRVHRLGTVRYCASGADEELAEFGFSVVVAEYVPADVTLMTHEPHSLDDRTKGVAREFALAERIALAEAAERYGAGDATTIETRRAALEELDDAVDPESLYAFNARQFDAVADVVEANPAPRRLWTRAQMRDGTARWVPAEAVLCPYRDPEQPTAAVLSTSNGVAAGSSFEQAADSALRELIERDAFMWTWVQRVSRERIDPASLPDAVRVDLALIESHGLLVDLINLTLETDPVVLCAVHTSEALCVGARCHADPLRAVEGALWEAVVGRFGIPDPETPLDAEDVEHPVDHEELYRSPEAVERGAFLYGSEELIPLGAVAGGEAPLDEAVAGIGEPVTAPLFVDLSSPRTEPFSVVRAIVPGLIPISFGFDIEPLGAPLLARPRRTADGRMVGRQLDLGRAGPLFPHPFA